MEAVGVIWKAWVDPPTRPWSWCMGYRLAALLSVLLARADAFTAGLAPIAPGLSLVGPRCDLHPRNTALHCRAQMEAAAVCPVFDAPGGQEQKDALRSLSLPEEERAFKKAYVSAAAQDGGQAAKFVSGVGVGVFVTDPKHPGCILLSRRKSSAGAGTWALPGGHLEFGETFEQCAARETKEETGVDLTNIRVVCVNNAVDLPANYHYVVVFLRGEATSAPRNMVCAGVCLRVLARAFLSTCRLPYSHSPVQEPQKHDDWQWVDWKSESFPSPLFAALRDIRSQGFDPFREHGS